MADLEPLAVGIGEGGGGAGDEEKTKRLLRVNLILSIEG